MDYKDRIEYKRQNIARWNEIAPRYHKRWVSTSRKGTSSTKQKISTTTTHAGPLRATSRLVQQVNAKSGDTALDVACGTGIVTRRLGQKVGKKGRVVGADMSMTALSIANRWNRDMHNIEFVNADAENLSFLNERFDLITCQYALFFFPDAAKALRAMRNKLKDSGTLGILVHGHIDRVPYHGSILDAVTQFIPNYTPPGTPALDRYSTEPALIREVKKAGFTDITVEAHTLWHTLDSFEEYWGNYLRYISRSDRQKLDTLTRQQRSDLKQAVRDNVLPYTNKKSGRIRFPWEVLILTARH